MGWFAGDITTRGKVDTYMYTGWWINSHIPLLCFHKPRKLELKLETPWTYFLFTLIFSWTFWIILLIQSKKPCFTPYGPSLYLGGVAPLVTATTLTYITQGRTETINLIKNTLNFQSITAKGLLIILVLSTLPNILSVLITKPQEAPLISMELSFGSSFPWFTFLFVVSIIEETGWRGYALPRLLALYNPLVSSLILGTIWATWHIPLFLVPGTWQHGLGFMTPKFVSYMLQLLPRTYLMTWVFIRTGNNTATAVLYHQFTNMTGELLDVTSRADLTRFMIEITLSTFLYII
jgi:membrane protease YdiL (CAAX protease family)